MWCCNNNFFSHLAQKVTLKISVNYNNTPFYSSGSLMGLMVMTSMISPHAGQTGVASEVELQRFCSQALWVVPLLSALDWLYIPCVLPHVMEAAHTIALIQVYGAARDCSAPTLMWGITKASMSSVKVTPRALPKPSALLQQHELL